MTVCALILHLRVLFLAGPLWRDEINGLNVALMPSFKEIWQSIAYYPFPIFHDLLLRLWIALGLGESDFQLRLFAFLTGLLLVVTIWIASRMLDGSRRPPLFLLALFALNPVVLQNGDWLRPYTVAMIFLIVLFVLVWRIIFNDARGMTSIASIFAAILAVQTVFQSAIMVFAICTAGIVVLLRNHQTRNAVRVFLVGVAAGLSLLPYVPVLRQAREWSSLARADNGVGRIIGTALGVITGENSMVTALWILVIVFVALTLVPSLKRYFGGEPKRDGDKILFASIAIVIGAAGTIAFVSVSGWLMPRYFLPFVAVAMMCTHVFVKARADAQFVRAANLVISLVIAAIFLPAAFAISAQRDTTCDWVGRALSQGAARDDVIVVTSFPFGISFARYYDGAAKWRTIPDVADHTQHRWDQALETMKRPDPLRETLSDIEAALKSGHRVFLVGALPAPDDPRNDAAGYMKAEEELRIRLAKFLKQHVAVGNRVPLGGEQPVQELENLPLFVCSGWLESPNDR